MSTYALNMNKDMNKVIVCLVSLLSVNAVDPKAAVDSNKAYHGAVETIKNEKHVVEHGNEHKANKKYHRTLKHKMHKRMHKDMHKGVKHEMHKDKVAKHEMHKDMHKGVKHEMHKAHKSAHMHEKVAKKEVATQTEK